MRFGVEFKPLNDFAIRAGTANNPSRFSAGFGVAVNLFSVDYAFFTHNDLGLTHQFSFSVHIDKKEDKQPPETEPVVATQASESSEETPEATQAAKEDREIEKIDINNATIDELETLPGIGEKLAQAIVRFREQNGRFDQVEDLVKVPGIGEKKLEKIIDKIFVRKISRK
ncbi:ComEA family DNA-binding protein [candidate division KSB1 bacterium]|nr:ComEA family DNA-binding protein [candidate division KSB1 bacterium]NIR72242.1 ComEA family DNA-binding protein [candidate division KSB1 bacterium]NIS23872.1 ComEA family DNA-binding protein [candidate division KSB1 bacterium]NIT70793.1 ComEA family DNA-binding protein [candidate division KSB1 bacterium]NIU24521.1 ComEA family DNA-binding protein [candidate division KSB1 bacterium]